MIRGAGAWVTLSSWDRPALEHPAGAAPGFRRMLAVAWPPVSFPPCWRGQPCPAIQVVLLPWGCRVAAVPPTVAQSRAATGSVTETT